MQSAKGVMSSPACYIENAQPPYRVPSYTISSQFTNGLSLLNARVILGLFKSHLPPQEAAHWQSTLLFRLNFNPQTQKVICMHSAKGAPPLDFNWSSWALFSSAKTATPEVGDLHAVCQGRHVDVE